MVLHCLRDGDAEPRVIQEGDTVVVYERFDAMKAVTVTTKGQYSNRFGNFAMKDWIGLPYGSRVHARAPDSGWAYVLAPTPELWTAVLRHRTQILYVADISMVIAMLELAPGAIVLESGTGSGSLTTSLARAVAPTGQVHTCEFHEQRAQLAREDFARNGLSDLVTVRHRNIERDGFPEELHGQADGLFLDLPGPWRAVPSAGRCLRPDGVFCAFSPCIEQVQRTCEALAKSGEFHCLQTMEVLVRSYEVSSVPLGVVAAGSAAEAQIPAAQAEESVDDAALSEAEPPSKKPKADSEPAAVRPSQPLTPAPKARVLARPVAAGRGHTGYLTFARRAVPVAGQPVGVEAEDAGEAAGEQAQADDAEQ